MKIYNAYEILFGFNDMWHFIHEAQNKNNSSISLKDFFEMTEPKRKWSLINPASVLSSAYAYFVFGQEKKLLNDFPVGNKNAKKFIKEFSITYDKYKKMTLEDKVCLIKRRLRNSIVHCRYSVEVRTDDGRPKKDGDIWYKFEDWKNDDSDKIIMEICLPSFGNIIEDAGAHTMKKLKDNNTEKA